MTKKDKIIYSYISNIIDDEKSNRLQFLTKKDISKFLKTVEKTNIIAVDRVQKNILDVFISGFTNDPKQNIRLIGNKK